MNKYINIIALFIFLMSLGAQAQVSLERDRLVSDTLHTELTKSEVQPLVEQIPDSLKPKPFKPDPMKVVWMGAIIPGYGQILNRKYWKLPIVYGGFLGFAYAITWNTGRFQTYKTAYRDIIDKDPNTNSFIQILPKGTTIDSRGVGGITAYTNTLKTGQDIYRRYRDLSIITAIGYYAVTLVEAYVDAQLYDFDISPDLSMKLNPILLKNSVGVSNTLGLQCSFSLK